MKKKIIIGTIEKEVKKGIEARQKLRESKKK